MIPSTQSSFLSYILSPEEIKAGSIFNLQQKAVIQNLIAASAEEKLALTFDPNNPQQFIQTEAELHGKIGILKYLLELESTLS